MNDNKALERCRERLATESARTTARWKRENRIIAVVLGLAMSALGIVFAYQRSLPPAIGCAFFTFWMGVLYRDSEPGPTTVK